MLIALLVDCMMCTHAYWKPITYSSDKNKALAV